MAEQINLIIKDEVVVETEFKDREGGNQHSSLVKKLFGHEKKVDIGMIKDNLAGCLDSVNDMLNDLKNRAVEGWELESVSISLAVSAEGSIGIATAGVEASIEVSFKPKKP